MSSHRSNTFGCAARGFARTFLCCLLSLAIALNPIYRGAQMAWALAVLASPLAALAQSPPPGAQEGQALGESLLHGPSTDGQRIYFQGANGTEAINATDLFQTRGSADDVQVMLDAFGDDGAAKGFAAAVQARLATEDSPQAKAYTTVRESAQARSHPDIITDPVFNRSEQVLQGDDPIFATFFEGCQDTEVPGSGSSTIHVPKPRYCDRVIVPVEQCEITHDYDAGLVRLIGGQGGAESCGEGCLDVYVGQVGDNYWEGNCTVFEQRVRLEVANADAITSAVLTEARWDDYMQIFIGDEKVWQSSPNFPPETAGACELNTSWVQNPNVDLTSHFKQDGILEFLIRVSVTRFGEGYAKIRLLYDPHRVVMQDQWTVSPECNALIGGISDGACSLTSMQCLDGPAMDVPCIDVNGYRVCQSDLSPAPLSGYSPLCRRGEIVGNCRFMSGPLECWTDPSGIEHCPQNDGGNPNGCAAFEQDPSCAFVSSSCLPFALGESGRCYAFEEQWDCGYSVEVPGSTTHRVTCDGPIRCMGEECVSPARESNPDFAKAAGTLSAMTFMSMDLNCANNDPDTCRIFGGQAMECKKALGGYQNCCDVPVSVGLADYLRLTMASYDLAKKLELGQKLANAGLNVPGAWDAVRNFASATWSKITQPFTSAWGSLTQSYGGAAVEQIEGFSLGALKQELVQETAQFVSDTFGENVAGLFFQQTGQNAAGEPIYGLSDTFASALNVIMWVYTIYLIVNILIDIIWACEQQEFLLAARREMLACTRVGSYCASDSPFGCIEVRDSYCCYNSPLARIVMEGAAAQFNMALGTPETPDCRGLTLAQVAALDWNQIDLTQWYGILAANGQIPNDANAFSTQYALENVTRNPLSIVPTPNAPERIQGEVDAAQYFDEARSKVRDDLWSSGP